MPRVTGSGGHDRPGGQPRDGDPRAMYAMFDLSSAQVAFHRVPYDFQSAAAAIRAAGLPEFFSPNAWRMDVENWLEPGTELDGFVIEDCIHAGGMAHIYRVHYASGPRDPGFPLAMKIPRMTAGDGAENIVSFEVEHQIMQVLTSYHAPRFVAAGDWTTSRIW